VAQSGEAFFVWVGVAFGATRDLGTTAPWRFRNVDDRREVIKTAEADYIRSIMSLAGDVHFSVRWRWSRNANHAEVVALARVTTTQHAIDADCDVLTTRLAVVPIHVTFDHVLRASELQQWLPPPGPDPMVRRCSRTVSTGTSPVGLHTWHVAPAVARRDDAWKAFCDLAFRGGGDVMLSTDLCGAPGVDREWVDEQRRSMMPFVSPERRLIGGGTQVIAADEFATAGSRVWSELLAGDGERLAFSTNLVTAGVGIADADHLAAQLTEAFLVDAMGTSDSIHLSTAPEAAAAAMTRLDVLRYAPLRPALPAAFDAICNTVSVEEAVALVAFPAAVEGRLPGYPVIGPGRSILGPADRSMAFLSYSREDDAVAYEFARAMSQHGVHIWQDVERIAPGHEFQAEFEAAIATCGVFICLVSRHAALSDWVREELRQAQAARRRIFQVLLDGTPPLVASSLGQPLRSRPIVSSLPEVLSLAEAVHRSLPTAH
jgi:TIR domain